MYYFYCRECNGDIESNEFLDICPKCNSKLVPISDVQSLDKYFAHYDDYIPYKGD